jgi:hypothetical protein
MTRTDSGIVDKSSGWSFSDLLRRKRVQLRWGLLALPLLLLTGAGGLSACSAECVLIPGRALQVEVISAVDGAPLDNVEVQATVNERPADVSQTGPGRFAVFGGEGTYVITVSREGFVPVIREIAVTADGCQIREEQVVIPLQPR